MAIATRQRGFFEPGRLQPAYPALSSQGGCYKPARLSRTKAATTSQPGSLEPGWLNLQPACLSRARAAIYAASPALSSQGGYISSIPDSDSDSDSDSGPGSGSDSDSNSDSDSDPFEQGQLSLQPAGLSRARAAKPPACPALSSQGGYICSLPGSFEPGRLYLKPAPICRGLRYAISQACAHLCADTPVSILARSAPIRRYADILYWLALRRSADILCRSRRYADKPI